MRCGCPRRTPGRARRGESASGRARCARRRRPRGPSRRARPRRARRTRWWPARRRRAHRRCARRAASRGSRGPRRDRSASVELGHEVVVVEDEARALAAQAACCQQQDVGRVARVDDVEAPVAREPAHQAPQAAQRLCVLARVAERVAGRAQRVAVDLDALEQLVRRVARSAPCAQATTTSQPAAARVRLMFHTRRSAGTGAFSLMMRTRPACITPPHGRRRRPARCAPGSSGSATANGCGRTRRRARSSARASARSGR